MELADLSSALGQREYENQNFGSISVFKVVVSDDRHAMWRSLDLDCNFKVHVYNLRYDTTRSGDSIHRLLWVIESSMVNFAPLSSQDFLHLRIGCKGLGIFVLE
jgi:hypothetical protein